jgi:hypothetical protein
MQSLLGNRTAHDPSRLQSAVHDIREAMLDCLSQYGKDATSLVHMRVSYAKDIQDLWYLRGDVMAVIAASDGEAVAKAKLSAISSRFRGLLPKGLVTRSSPLGF